MRVATTALILLVAGGCSDHDAVLADAADGQADVVVEATDSAVEGEADEAEADVGETEQQDSAEPSDAGVGEAPISETAVDAGAEGASDGDGPGDVNDAGRAVGTFTIDPKLYLSTTEAGGQAKFTIVLDTLPLANVMVPLKSSNTDEGTVLPAILTFTPADWNVPQVVTITGVDDSDCDGNQRYMIVTGPAVSADPAYDGADPPDPPVTNVDNEGGGITVIPGSLTTSEKGGTASFAVVLNCRPTADVTIPCTSTNLAEGRVDPGAVVLTRANWNRPAPVTVTGVDDGVHDGDQTYRVRVGPAMSSDLGFNGIVTGVTVTNLDDD